jgi:tetratricopeptide (TPR) repeat protein
MLASRVAETLVQARRLKSEGLLVAARDLLASGQKKWPAKTLATELAQVKKKLEQRQRSLVKLMRSAVKKEQFVQAAQRLTQVRQLGVDPALIAEVNTELKKARSRARTEHLELARQQVENGNYDAGLKAYRRVLDIEPGNKEALQGLQQGREALEGTISRLLVEGAAARKAAQVDQARVAYRKVLNLDPHRAEALAALHQIGRSGQARLTSVDSQHLYLQGIELYTEGDYKQAIAIWYQVLDLDPDHRKARRNIEKARRKLKQIQERQSG